ncbi:MAG: hypothetical protein IID37_01805 [Planctomycetes bacterium]|nr:hypothetical protein [Planctomycetota bacterium]
MVVTFVIGGCPGTPPPPPPEPGPGVFVRGYIATRVFELGPGGVTGRAPTTSQDIYIPGVKVFLTDTLTAATTDPVTTDLSGRFTTPLVQPGRYQVCWTASGYIDGCSDDIFSVDDQPLHVSKVLMPIDPPSGSTVVFGRVSFADGAPPRYLAPLANINAFAQVVLLDESGSELQRVYVNNFGHYVLPEVPGGVELTIRTVIEGAVQDHEIWAAADLASLSFHRINQVIANSPPRLDPLVAVDAMGRRVRTALPGSVVELTARGSDADGDDVSYRWHVAAGSGTLDGIDAPSVSWTLPGALGRYSVTVYAYDGKGGYAESYLSLVATKDGISFSGQVSATDSPVVDGATIEVNGQITTTDASGSFFLQVPDADRFVLNIRKTGYGLVSKIYDDAVEGGHWTMVRGTLLTVNPTQPIVVTDQRGDLNCPGPAAEQLDWESFPGLIQPQYQDGKSNVVAPFGELGFPLPGERDPELRRVCGPGLSVSIPANSLVGKDGKPPLGNVDVTISTIDLSTPSQMPGDYTVTDGDGGTMVMQSYGAGGIEINDGLQTYNLMNGVIATITIPVDPSQLAAGGELPETIPVLFYNEVDGVWEEEGIARLEGTNYVAEVTHFSTINTDLVKTDQACVRILSPDLPAAYELEVTIPQGDAAPKIISAVIDNAAPSEHVIYNLPIEVSIVLVPIDLDSNTPLGTFVVNTGGAQVPTDPNKPDGPPYDACSTEVTLTILSVPNDPSVGEFLHGLTTFEATDLDELDLADPTDSALATALDDATVDYYEQIDPCGRRLTLDGFMTANGFGGTAVEYHAVFANSGDLGFGRDMYCARDGDNVACFVTNYGDITTDDGADVINAILQNGPIATVAMEYSPIENADDCPTVVLDEVEQVVKFYVYNSDGSALVNSAPLDENGSRPVPQLCMVCHGGAYPGGVVVGAAPAFASRDDVKLGSKFLPFDLSLYTFTPAPTATDKATQQPDFKLLNEDIVAGSPPDTAIEEVITKMYDGVAVQDEEFVVDGWNATGLEQQMYRDVVARSCRTCHIGNFDAELQFDQSADLKDTLLGAVEGRVCTEFVMPHAKVTFDLFWTSTDPHEPAILQVYGDNFASVANGWNGEICGEFTPGGESPMSVYEMEIQPIWNGTGTGAAACTGCHGFAGGLSLSAGTSHGNIVGVASSAGMNLVEAGDHLNSYLWHKINGTQGGVSGGSGGQMPDGCPTGTNPCLSSTDIDKVADWIDDGADP